MKFVKMKSLIITVLSLVCYVASLKILVIYPLPIRSINFLGRSVVQNLLNDGHQVTYIAADPLNIPQNKNFRQIDVSSNKDILKDSVWNIGNILKYKVENEYRGIQDFCVDIAKRTFNHENVTNFLAKPDEHFDAIFGDLIESEVYAGLSVLYNCPMLWFFSMGAHWQVVRLLADPSSPAYDTDYYGTNVPPFTFTQRVEELISRAKWMYYKSFYTLPAEREIYEKTFGPLLARKGRALPDYEEVIFNSSMIFGNEHNAIVGRPSTPQNFKYVGGIHIDDPVKPLPKDLQNLLDNAPHGVIYFSMGTFLKSKDLPAEFIRDLLELFGELKQTVLWKFEDNLKDIPKNVHIVKWAPQQSILAHPNCKFFISHGGLLSSIETIHFGKPIIGIPGMLDQIINVNKAVSHGFAIKVNLDYDTPKNLKLAIDKMLNNDSYYKKAQELSFIYHDRPTKPGDELTYWVRHVVKTNGAWYLRSPAINVPLYQRVYLDLLALILGVVFVLCWSVCMLFKKRNGTKKNLEKKKK